jgi:hypothetical protein
MVVIINNKIKNLILSIKANNNLIISIIKDIKIEEVHIITIQQDLIKILINKIFPNKINKEIIKIIDKTNNKLLIYHIINKDLIET